MELNENAIGFCWFTGISCICIAIWYSEERDIVRAGIHTVSGHSQEADINAVIDCGSHFPLEEAISLVDKHGGWVKPEKEKWKPKPKSDGPLKLKLKYKNESEKRKQKEGTAEHIKVFDFSGNVAKYIEFDPNILL